MEAAESGSKFKEVNLLEKVRFCGRFVSAALLLTCRISCLQHVLRKRLFRKHPLSHRV